MHQTIVVFVLAIAFVTPGSFSYAVTAEEIQQQIATLQSQLTTLQSQATATETTGNATSTEGYGSITGPKKKPMCLEGTRRLRFGMRGDDVRELQRFLLAAAGSPESPDYMTGYFGRGTEAALKKWQFVYKIVSSGTPDTTGYGVLGPKTRAAMREQCLKSATTCAVGGVVLADGESRVLYGLQKSGGEASCKDRAQVRTCNTGTLAGPIEFRFAECSNEGPFSCKVGSMTVKHQQTATLYATDRVPPGDSCERVSAQRTCDNGTLSGHERFVYGLCSVGSVEGSVLGAKDLSEVLLMASGNACRTGAGDRAAGTLLSEQYITGKKYFGRSVLPWFRCSSGVWYCSTFCPFLGARLWYDGGSWKANYNAESLTAPQNYADVVVTYGGFTSTTTGQSTYQPYIPTIPAGGDQILARGCEYAAGLYPEGTHTEGRDIDHLCLGAYVNLCSVQDQVLPQWECRNKAWERSSVNIPSPTTYPGNCVPGQAQCHFCPSGNYGYWTTAPTCSS